MHFVQCGIHVEQNIPVAKHQGGWQNICGVILHHKTVGCLKTLIIAYEELHIPAERDLLGVKKTRSVQDKQNQGESGQLAETVNVHEKRG